MTRAAFQLVATASWLYERGGYAGPVDVGVAILSIERARGAALSNGWGDNPEYGAANFRTDARVTMTELRRDPEAVTRELLSGLFDVVSPHDYDPFAERRR